MNWYLSIISLLSFLVFIGGRSVAQEHTISVTNVSGGVNISALPDVLPPGMFTILQNVILSHEGMIEKRWAFVRGPNAPGGSSAINGLTIWVNGTTSYLVSVADSIRYSTGTTWTAVTPTPQASTANLFDFTSFNNRLIMTSSGDSTRGWLAAAASFIALAGGAPVNGKYTRAYKNYLFIGGNSAAATANRIWFSTLGDQTTWGANDYIDCEPYDGDEIMGLEVYEARLWIFKRRSVFMLEGDGPSNFVLQRVLSGIGLLDARSLQVTEERMFWGNIDGVYEMSTQGVQKISDPIASYFEDIGDSTIYLAGGTTVNYMASAILQRYKQYFLAFAIDSSAVVNRMFVYHYDRRVWTSFTEGFYSGGSPEDFDLRAMTSGPTAGTQPLRPLVYIARTGGQRVYYYPASSTIGDELGAGGASVIPTRIRFPPLSGGLPHLMKQWRWLYLTWVTSGADTLTVTGLSANQTSTVSTSGTNRIRVRLDTRSKALAPEIVHTTATRPSFGNFLFLFVPQSWEP